MAVVMIDPTLLLSARGSDWVRSERSGLVVSSSFMLMLDADPEGTLRHLGVVESDMSTVVSRAFASAPEPYTPIREAPRDIRRGVEVVERELAAAGPLGVVYAEQWRFLNTESWLLSARRWFLDQLHKKGAPVVEHGKAASEAVLRQLISSVIPGPVPPQVDAAIAARVAVKWIVVGGATVGLAPIAAPVSAGMGVFGLPIARAFDP